jgi:Helix-turn-helix
VSAIGPWAAALDEIVEADAALPPRARRTVHAMLTELHIPRECLGAARTHVARRRREAARGITFDRELRAAVMAARVTRGLSRDDVEARSGGRIKTGALGTWERGSRSIYVEQLAMLAEFYGVPAASLIPPLRDEP